MCRRRRRCSICRGERNQALSHGNKHEGGLRMYCCPFPRLLVAGLLALLALTPAFATPPDMYTVPIDETFPVTDPYGTPICSFPVEGHFEGTARIATHYDRSGNPTFELLTSTRGLWLFTMTNPATGKSFT